MRNKVQFHITLVASLLALSTLISASAIVLSDRVSTAALVAGAFGIVGTLIYDASLEPHDTTMVRVSDRTSVSRTRFVRRAYDIDATPIAAVQKIVQPLLLNEPLHIASVLKSGELLPTRELSFYSAAGILTGP